MDRLQGKETSAAQRETIITLHEAEVPVREISRRLNIPKRTVHRWIKLQKERGTLRSMPRSGAPRCTTSEQDQLIIATVQQQPLTNAVEIKQKLGLTVGVQTVRNRLNKLAQWKQLRCYETYVPHRPKNQQKKMTQKSVTLESAVQVKQVTDQRNGKQSEVKTEVMEDIEHQEMEGNEDLNQRNDRPSSVKTEVIEDFDQMNNSDVQTETIKNFDQKNCNTVKTERTENFGPDFANFSDQYNQSQLYCDVIEIEKEEYDFDFVEVSDEQQGKGENSNNIEITQRKFKGVKRKFDPSINLSSSDMEFSKEEEYEDFDPLTVDSDDIQVMQLRRKLLAEWWSDDEDLPCDENSGIDDEELIEFGEEGIGKEGRCTSTDKEGGPVVNVSHAPHTHNPISASSDTHVIPNVSSLSATARPESTCSVSKDFMWDWSSAKTYTHTSFNFDDSNCGVQIKAEVGQDFTESEIFLQYFDDDIVNFIVRKTNKYHADLMESMKEKVQSKFCNIEPITANEFYLFISVMMLMAHCKKSAMEEYWTSDILIETPMFGKIMSQDRFFFIYKLLRFNDIGVPQISDKLYKVRPVLEYLKKKFSNMLKPNQNLVMDDVLVLRKGHFPMKHYVPVKRQPYVMKMFVLCDCDTGYILDFIPHTGNSNKTDPLNNHSISEWIVKTMMNDYIGKGHHLYLKDWHGSPYLFEHFYTNKTGLCTMVVGQKDFLPDFPRSEKGDCISYNCHNVVAVQWKGKRDMTFLTTIHGDAVVQSDKVDNVTGQRICKPVVILDYTSNVRSNTVHLEKAHLVSLQECVHGISKWHIKFFIHLLDLTIFNSYKLYTVKARKKRKPTHVEFRLNIIRQLLKKYSLSESTSETYKYQILDGMHLCEKFSQSEIPSVNNQRSPQATIHRLNERHFLSMSTSTRRQCYVCSHTSQRDRKQCKTKFSCFECGIYLCQVPCFEIFHTIENY